MPKCEAECKPWKYYSDRIIYKDCDFNASVNIDGINLCLHHAGTIAVRKLIQLGKAERIIYEDKYKKQNLCSLDMF